jgi:hypothetical protein
MTVVRSSESSTPPVSRTGVELREIVVSRLCERCVRGRFNSLSDPSISTALFSGIVLGMVDFRTRVRRAFFSTTIRLRFASSATFCVYLASRVAFRSAFFWAS